MTSDWTRIPLGDLVHLQRGHDLTAEERRSGTVPVMGSAGQAGLHDTAKTDGPGVVIGRSGVGSMGAVHYCPVPFWPHNTTLYVTDFRGNVRRFVYFAFKTINFRTFDSGSVQASLNRNNLYSMPLWRPPLQEQHAIASLLGALDDKIELNRRRNETLEELARTIFKSWFVEFDPVRAKAEGRQPVGMDAETAALFPSGLVESELGEIPEGWRTGTLGTVSTYLRRGFGPGYAETGGVCVLNQKCIRDGRLDLGKARRHDVSKKPVEGRQLQLGDLLVNSTGVGTLGRVAQVWRLPELTIVDSHVTVVRADPNILSPIVLGVDLGRREAEVEALGEGSTGQTELSRERLAQLSVLMASRGVQQRFATLVEPMRQRMIVSEEESASLAGLRDLLLPKLISGDLRIPLAEKMAQAVL